MVAMYQRLSDCHQGQMKAIRSLNMTLDGGKCSRVLNSYDNCFDKAQLEADYKEEKVV